MPVASSSTTSGRLLTLLSLLQSRRDWPARVLSERLAVSERTVRRDVERLRELDYAIAATRGPDGGYRLQAGAELPPLLLDDEQAVAVAVALRAAGALGLGIEDAAERALRTVARLMPDRLVHRIDSVELATAALPADVDPAVLLRITAAVRAGEELRFDYGESDGAAPARRAEPHHLLFRNGRWYLLAWAPDRDDWRTYRVDRLRLRSHTGRRFTPREVPGGDPAAFLAARFTGGTDTWPCWGEALVHARAAEVAPYVGDGTAEARDEHTTRVRLGSWSWPGLAASFARFDAELGEVSPAPLRQALAALGERASRAATAS